MTGRRPKSYDMGPMIRVDLPIFQVSALLPKVEQMYAQVYEEEWPAVKEMLLKKGYKKIKAEQLDWTYLPRSCPKCCMNGGHPVFQRYKRARSEQRPNIHRNDQIRFKIYYNHSKPRYRTCFIGYLVGGYIQLSKKIDPKKMNPSNWIDKNKMEWFRSPKIRKPRKLA